MRRIAGMTLLVAAVAAAPLSAGAVARCDSKLNVMSGTSVIVGGASSATCIHNATKGIDSRLIHGDHVMVTFDSTYVRGNPFVMARANGLGWRNEYIPLGFVPGDPGPKDDIYKSGFLELPHGAMATGCLTVTLTVTEKRGRKTVTRYKDSQTYHTAGVNC